ncbi:MAG: iron(III) transport system substrate-binding protein [Mycobacterium sp.]|jgi:iron(III) transport system substrate-binding protein|nr:iron(III) transport system substrate-binding protein [Mycobacterium sp.]MDT5297890.1 iron(III) transport system substrate-binding protein [Mycobacterium sp.]
MRITRWRQLRFARAAVAAALVVGLTACGGGGVSNSSGPGAKNIVYYTTRPEDGLPELKKAFESANAGYTLEVIRGSSSDMVARLITEASAHQQKADVVEINSLPMSDLAHANILGTLPASITDKLPERAKAPDGTYAGTRYFGHLTPYNTQLVPQNEWPTSYMDFLKPYWKGNFIVGANDVEWAYQVYASMGPERGMDLFKQMAAQNPQVRDEGRGALAELIAVGQAKAAVMTLEYHVVNRQKKDMPIAGAKWNPPLLNIDWLATFKDAPHPDATAVFLNWLYSDEGIATDAGLGFNRIGDAGTQAALADPKLLILSPSTADVQKKAADDFESVFSAQ